MTDSELIKALENSINTYNEKGVYVDTENLQQQVFDLIKRQKKELEAIKDERAIVFKLSEEQINEVNENLLKSVEYNERKIKAEAYKEFATKIYQAFTVENTRDGYLDCTPNYTRLMECVDNVLKELVGDNK